ncbi:MAG: RNA 2',3'-cyclic phosphodiesterase [Candidatus Eisenbacteria bacterium]
MNGATTRAFVAVFPPPEVVAAVGAALDLLRTPGDGIAWVPPANLHYTMRFLGDLEPARLDAARRALGTAAAGSGVAPFRVRLGGPGAFPGPGRPRVLWLGAAEGAAALTLLAGGLEGALEREKFARSERPFTPHLTTGRVREPGAAAVAAATGRFLGATFPGAAFEVAELVLVASTLAPGGSRYEPLERAALGGAA